MVRGGDGEKVGFRRKGIFNGGGGGGRCFVLVETSLLVEFHRLS